MIAWRARYRAGGIDALADLPRSGRPPVIDETVVVVTATLNPPPAELGVTHWSSRLLADHLSEAGLPVSTFTSVPDLLGAIGTFIDAYHQRCQPFSWTTTADQILAKADRRRTSTRGRQPPRDAS